MDYFFAKAAIIYLFLLQTVNPQLQTMADRCGGGGGWNRNRYAGGRGGGSFKRGSNFGRGNGGGGHKRFNEY